MRPIRYAMAGLVLLGTLALVGVAQADEVEARETKGDDGWGYIFRDDPLASGAVGPNDVQIRVRQGPIRETLIRPRTSFVPQMLKSVENL